MTFQELLKTFDTIEKIKKGGQKTVYKATINNKTIILKTVGIADDPRILQEIDLIKNLNVQFTPRILDSNIVTDETTNEDILYIIEEYVDGLSLRDWLNLGHRFDLPTAYHVLLSLLKIEVDLEKLGILHRDINPNNIIIDKNNTITLIDFGLAKNLLGTSLTRTDSQFGPFTPGYAPHEQFGNMKMKQDVRTDLFQIGVTIYECCSGNNPFIEHNQSIYDIMSRTISINPPALIFDGDTKGMFSQFILMLMAKQQSQRPNTAATAMRYLLAIESSLSLEV